MKPEFENYEHLEPISWLYGLGGALVSCLAFHCVHPVVKRFAIPASLTDRKSRWKWQNILISWSHAVIVGVWVLSCFYYYPEVTQDLIAFHNSYSYGVVAFSTGYFVSDFVDIVVNSPRYGMWEVLLHHVAVLSIFFYNIGVCRYIGYTNVALLVEVHSISLHLRKMMQMFGVSFNNIIYRVNNIVNLVMFLCFRMLAIAWISLGMVWYKDRMSSGYLFLLGLTMFVMWIINLILFWRLIKNDILRNIGRRHVTENGNKTHTGRSVNENNNRHRIK